MTDKKDLPTNLIQYKHMEIFKDI